MPGVNETWEADEMKLSISNIAWEAMEDEQMYVCMKRHGYTGLEIAPTRIFPDAPYDRLSEAAVWRGTLYETYGLVISSMQSIWFGRTERLFGSEKERAALMEYTRKAIDFAAATGCRNLVFGCPKNRVLPDGVNAKIAISFFREAGAYAHARGTVIGMEANPPIYHTNYINDTQAALRLIREVDSVGFKLNLDVGTMIANGEKTGILSGQTDLINHVHISEPGLKRIEKNQLHRELCALLTEEGYGGFVSVEMGKGHSREELEETMEYVHDVFG